MGNSIFGDYSRNRGESFMYQDQVSDERPCHNTLVVAVVVVVVVVVVIEVVVIVVVVVLSHSEEDPADRLLTLLHDGGWWWWWWPCSHQLIPPQHYVPSGPWIRNA